MNRKQLALIAKAAISALLIWYLLERVDLAQIVARARALDAGEASLSILVLALQTAFVTIRWWLLTRVVGAELRLSAALRILLIGMFFNQTLPSSVGGDAVRVWLVTREGTTLGKALNVVLCDRVLAMMVLVGIIGASLPAVYARIEDEATRAALTILVALSGLGLAVFLVMGTHVAHLLRRWNLTRPFGNLATDFHQIFKRPAPLTVLIALSAAIHLQTVAVVMVLADGLELPVTFIDSLVVVPTVILLTTLPVSVAGWGVREGAMVAGFGLLGVAADGALALSVLFGVATIVISLPGGLVWLVGRPRGETSDLGRASPS